MFPPCKIDAHTHTVYVWRTLQGHARARHAGQGPFQSGPVQIPGERASECFLPVSYTLDTSIRRILQGAHTPAEGAVYIHLGSTLESRTHGIQTDGISQGGECSLARGGTTSVWTRRIVWWTSASRRRCASEVAAFPMTATDHLGYPLNAHASSRQTGFNEILCAGSSPTSRCSARPCSSRRRCPRRLKSSLAPCWSTPSW